MGGTHSTKHLPKEEIKKLVAKTHFTEAQIRRWYKDFLVSVKLRYSAFINTRNRDTYDVKHG